MQTWRDNRTSHFHVYPCSHQFLQAYKCYNYGYTQTEGPPGSPGYPFLFINAQQTASASVYHLRVEVPEHPKTLEPTYTEILTTDVREKIYYSLHENFSIICFSVFP